MPLEKDPDLLFVARRVLFGRKCSFVILIIQVTTLLKQFDLGTTDDIVPIIYAGLVDPLLAVRAQVTF